MSDKTGIGYVDATWQPGAGCTRISPGCKNCWAIGTVRRLDANYKVSADYSGLVRETENGADWTGKVNLFPDRLNKPLEWRKPRIIAVWFQGDLFHSEVPNEYLDRVFATMALAEQHVFLLLTKRPRRMLEYLTATGSLQSTPENIADAAHQLHGVIWDARGSDRWKYSRGALTPDLEKRRPWPGWPLPNVWAGLSVSTQGEWHQKREFFLKTPAAGHWLSLEPLLESIMLNLEDVPGDWWCETCQAFLDGSRVEPDETCDTCHEPVKVRPILDFVTAGCEQLPGGRPGRPSKDGWFGELFNQCKEYKIPFYLKQAESNGIVVKEPGIWINPMNDLPEGWR